jgi:hypothetical protein
MEPARKAGTRASDWASAVQRVPTRVNFIRLPLLRLSIFALLSALWAGLLRLGWGLPATTRRCLGRGRGVRVTCLVHWPAMAETIIVEVQRFSPESGQEAHFDSFEIPYRRAPLRASTRAYRQR